VKIIGISGKAGAGKDTCANILAKHYITKGLASQVLYFADPLKQALMSDFGLTYQQTYGTQEEKNSLTHYKWSDMPGVVIMDKDGNNPICPVNYPEIKVLREDGYMTARELMEYYGTNIMRRIKNNYWADKASNQITANTKDIALIPDTRFINEVEAIKKLGGIVIRLTRGDYNNKHTSNTALDNYEDFDIIIDNRNKTIDQTAFELIDRVERKLA
jgi:hypothetical protein